MSVFSKLFNTDVGIDLGSSRTRVWIKGKGLVLDEPSVVLVNARHKDVIAIGEEAMRMLAEPSCRAMTVSPIRNGVISDDNISMPMIKHFIDKACSRCLTGKFAKRRRFVVTVPSGITEEEKNLLELGVKAAWVDDNRFSEDMPEEDVMKLLARTEVFMIEAVMAAAIGAGLPVSAPQGCMVVDIGSDKCDVAIISLAGIVHSHSVRGAGGKDMDNAIIDYIRKRYDLIIGKRMAECIKMTIGSVYPTGGALEINGRTMSTGMEKTITITSEEIRGELKKPVDKIVEAVKATLEKCEPELAADLVDNGFVLTGGGALLLGLDRRLANAIGLSVHVAEAPANATIRGVATVLEELDFLEKHKRENQT